MDRESMLSMDPNILVSIINMKLRDFYSSLGSLCDDLNIEMHELKEKLKDANYEYNIDINQFK